jgi:phosphoglycolate phosphatase-like HAD superfamily hydrolase
MSKVSQIVLFDIDGTLITSGRAGARGMDAAFLALYGVTGALKGVSLAGRTDHAIVSDVMRAIGREPTREAVRHLRDTYLEHLPREMAIPHPDNRVLPGVHAVLDVLATRDDIAVGLLTGNFERGAAIKLGHFDLWRRFAFGAFGDDHVNRRDLVPLALQAAARAGAEVPVSQVVVIGDTPLDIDCARHHSVRSVGVATGMFGRDALVSAEADLVLDTLADTDAVMNFLLAPSQKSKVRSQK